MGELYDMDLKGRPLAYTPFCDNNKEMDGYRFWKQVSYQLSTNHTTAVDQIIHGRLKMFSSCLSADSCSFPRVFKGFLERSFARKTIPYQVGDLLHQACLNRLLLLFCNTIVVSVPFMLLIWPNFDKLLLGIIYGLFMKHSARTPIVSQTLIRYIYLIPFTRNI